jgi:hypothetical protein
MWLRIRVRLGVRLESWVMTHVGYPAGSEFQNEQLCSALNSASELGADRCPSRTAAGAHRSMEHRVHRQCG